MEASEDLTPRDAPGAAALDRAAEALLQKGPGLEDLIRLAAEVGPRVAGARVRRVRSRGRAVVVELKGEADRETALVLDLLGPAPCVGAAPRDEVPPTGEPVRGFAEHARDHLENRRVEAWTQDPTDRLARLSLEGGGGLVLLFAGRRSDAVLVDGEGRVVRSARALAGQQGAPGPGEALSVPVPRPGRTRPPALLPHLAPDPGALAYGRALLEVGRRAAALAARGEDARALERELKKRQRRAERAVRALEATIADAASGALDRRRGDLLLASLHLVRRGAAEVRVPDYYAGGDEVAIALDPALAPNDQAARYFRRAKKKERGAAVAAERVKEKRAEAARLGAALAALGRGADPHEAAAAAGVRVPRSGPGRSAGAGGASAPRSGPRRFRSRDGLLLLVGRSNEENDVLTLRTARGRDLFFHASGVPGAHVIVRADAGEAPPETVLDAAHLAVYYSKARGRGRTLVAYTPRKYVRKPKGAPPGRVELERHDTVWVDEDAARLERVLATGGGRADEPGGASERPTQECEGVNAS